MQPNAAAAHPWDSFAFVWTAVFAVCSLDSSYAYDAHASCAFFHAGPAHHQPRRASAGGAGEFRQSLAAAEQLSTGPVLAAAAIPWRNECIGVWVDTGPTPRPPPWTAALWATAARDDRIATGCEWFWALSVICLRTAVNGCMRSKSVNQGVVARGCRYMMCHEHQLRAHHDVAENARECRDLRYFYVCRLALV